MEIEDAEAFAARCADVVGTILSKDSLAFNRSRKSRRLRPLYVLAGGPSTSKANDSRYEYTVIPLGHGPNGLLFWITVALQLEYDSGVSYLDQVRIVVFQGGYTDTGKVPLLRAEWAKTTESDRAKHAQPHWHVYVASMASEDFPPYSPLVDTGPRDFSEVSAQTKQHDISQEWDQGADFHFAMASRWHLDGPEAHQEVLEQAKVLKWLEGCVTYIVAQFEYLYDGIGA